MGSLKRLTLASLASLLLAGGAAQAEQIVLSNWDGYMPPDLLENFTKETGIEVVFTPHATNEEIMGKLVAGGGAGYDVVFVSGQFAEALYNLGLAADLDHAQIPNLANLYPEANQLPYDLGNKHSVPYAWGTTGLCWRSDLLAEAPDSWMDLLQPAPEVAGKTTMLATDRWLMMPAQLALGLSLNDASDESLAKAKELLIAAKKTLLSYDDTTFYAKLVSGEAVLVEAWDGWCNYGIAENAAIQYAVPSEGSDLWVDTMVVIKGAANPEGAHKFINYVLRADVGTWVASNILYKTPNKAGMDAVDPAILDAFPNMKMAPADMLKYEQLRDLGDRQAAFTQTVQEILAAQ